MEYISDALYKKFTAPNSMAPEKQFAYRVQGNLTLEKIEYPLYVLDGSLTTTTLTLPTSTQMAQEHGTIITLLNPTKDNFAINGNGVNIVRGATETATITLTEYESIKLILLDIGKDHDFLWYELITIPPTDPAVITTAVETYLIANPPSGGLTISQIKTDTEISDTISKRHTNASDHAPNSDNQDLSNLVVKVTGSELLATTEAAKIHTSGSDMETSSTIGAMFANVAVKATPIDADNFGYPDSEAANIIKRLTWANIKTALAAVFQSTLVSATNIKTINGVTVLGAGNMVVSGTDPFLAKLVLAADKPTGANITPVTLGLSFNYVANSQYVIDIYAIVAPTAATTGCGFMIDVSTVVTYVGTFVNHQLAITGTTSGAASIGDLAATSSGVSSGMVSTASQFVYGGGILITGANAGTATFFFRSETTAVTTCKTGTSIRVLKMN